MESLTFNKIAGSVLSALLVIVGGGVLVGEMYPSGKPKGEGALKEITIVEVKAKEEAAPAPAEGAAAPAGGGGEAEKPVAVLLAAAKPEEGEGVAKRCSACHSYDKGGKNGVGPNLHEIVGRAIGGVQGFNYSAGLKGKGGEWNYESLDAFLKSPKDYAPGTMMAFAGLRKPEDRAAVIAYLRSLSDAPKPLPPTQ